ncbi:MAG: PHP domain-containing protein [Planctomycetota bacterium]|nr:PHP domain-containing protein [Planctomycetota bacterium]
MRRFVDLHTHSTASDGDLRPADLVRQAEAEHLAALALTDHDTVAGLNEARRAAESLEVRFVPGIEISAIFAGGMLHIIGLGVDSNNGHLQEITRLLRQARNERNPQMVAKLRELGMDVSMNELVALASHGNRSDTDSVMVGRMHMAKLLRIKGCVGSEAEAFERYIGNGRPAYVDKERLSAREVIDAVHSAGGMAILAHPCELNCANNAVLERVVKSLVHDGIDGIEVYHSSHRDRQTSTYLNLARSLRLMVSGGSDFHGSAKSGVKLGRPRVPLEVVEQILAKVTV